MLFFPVFILVFVLKKEEIGRALNNVLTDHFFEQVSAKMMDCF